MKKLKHLLIKLNTKCEQAIYSYGAEYDLFTIFICVTFIVPYLIWDHTQVDINRLTTIRIIVGTIGTAILFRGMWDSKLIKFLPLCWYISLFLCIPFLSTTVYLFNYGRQGWLIFMLINMFALSILVAWVQFLILNILGLCLAIIVYYFVATSPFQEFNWENWYDFLYAYLLVFIITLIFARKKSISDSQKTNIIKIYGSSIAHEMDNIFSILTNHLNDLEKSKEIDRYYIRASKVIDRGYEIIDTILMHGKSKNEYIIDTIDFSKFISQLRDDYQNAIDFSCVKSIIEHRSGNVVSDIKTLKIVIVNLIKNSLEAFVCVKTKKIITIKLSENKGTDYITIEDNGVGIRKDIINNIFSPFYTTKKTGTGIGLTLCKKLLQDMDCDIECISEQGLGTKFVINFPKANEKSFKGK